MTNHLKQPINRTLIFCEILYDVSFAYMGLKTQNRKICIEKVKSLSFQCNILKEDKGQLIAKSLLFT